MYVFVASLFCSSLLVTLGGFSICLCTYLEILGTVYTTHCTVYLSGVPNALFTTVCKVYTIDYRRYCFDLHTPVYICGYTLRSRSRKHTLIFVNVRCFNVP